VARHRKDVDFERPSDEAMSLGRNRGWGFDYPKPKHRKLVVGDIIIPIRGNQVRYAVQDVWQQGSDVKFSARGLQPYTSVQYIGYERAVVRVPWA